MHESVRVTVEDGDENEVVRIRGSTGEVTAGDATFRFDVGGAASANADADAEPSGDATSAGRRDGDGRRRIASAEDVPNRGTLRFEAIDDRRRVDGILQRLDDGGIVAWENSCPHEPEVKLDRGLGALVDGDQLVCHEHGARFDRDDGYCTRGPCRGRSLSSIDVSVRDGDVYLTDERFAAGRRPDA